MGTVEMLKPYMIDVDELRKTVQELGEKLATADEHNQKVQAIYDNLCASGVVEATITAALDAEFGKPKVKRTRAPKRTDKTPTIGEKKLLSVMTSEGMSKIDIYKAAGMESTEENKTLLQGMQRLGWVNNSGGKGRAAAWVITDAGQALVAD